jgi:hypothetical protein
VKSRLGLKPASAAPSASDDPRMPRQTERQRRLRELEQSIRAHTAATEESRRQLGLLALGILERPEEFLLLLAGGPLIMSSRTTSQPTEVQALLAATPGQSPMRALLFSLKLSDVETMAFPLAGLRPFSRVPKVSAFASCATRPRTRRVRVLAAERRREGLGAKRQPADVLRTAVGTAGAGGARRCSSAEFVRDAVSWVPSVRALMKTWT